MLLLKHLLATVATIFICLAAGAAADAQMHPPEPVVNLGGTSFLDGVAGPGILVEKFADGYHGSHVNGSDGAQVSGSRGVYSAVGITYGEHGWALKSCRRSLTQMQEMASRPTGAGDLTFSPVILQWPERRLGGMALMKRVVFDFGVPTGEYQSSAPLSLSTHHFDINPLLRGVQVPNEAR